jgi:hypothetical protein
MDAAEKIWSLVVNQLAAHTTKPTMNTWVYPVRAGSWDPDREILTIIAPNAFTKDWLANRLAQTIERELVGITGHQARVQIVVDEDTDVIPPDVLQPPDSPSSWLKFYEFDPMKRGFLQVPKYVEYFWQPYLGPIAYATYRFLRCLDKQNEGWGQWHRVSIRRIAETCANGNRQAISGVQRKRGDGTTYHQKGTLDTLSEVGIIRIKRLGPTRARCLISCLNSLPLLTPVQVASLPDTLQWYHAEELRAAKLAQEEWEQIEPESLVQE